MSFKIFNTNIEENEKINDTNAKIVQLQAAVTDLQNGGGGGTGGIGLRDIIVYDGVGGSILTYASNGTIAYSLNQIPGQIIIDADVQSPPVGTEFIIYAGSNNTAYMQNAKTSGRIQISGAATNTSNADVYVAINSKCTVTKLTNTLWVAQGDGLTYAS